MSASQPLGQAGAPGGTTHDAGAPQAAPSGDVAGLRRDVEETAEVALERGRGFAAAVKSHATTYAEGRKTDAARSVADIAQSIRDSSATFDDRPNIKAFFDSAAEGLDEFAGSIERRSFNDLYAEAETLARRSPFAVAAATFAAGLLLARFVKASGSASGSAPDPRDADDRFRN